MEFLHVDRRWGFGLAVATENLGSPFKKLIPPLLDLVGVDVELLRQFRQRLLALDRSQRCLRLESRGVVAANSSRHGVSCSRHHADLRQKLHLARVSEFHEPALFEFDSVGRRRRWSANTPIRLQRVKPL